MTSLLLKYEGRIIVWIKYWSTVLWKFVFHWKCFARRTSWKKFFINQYLKLTSMPCFPGSSPASFSIGVSLRKFLLQVSVHPWSANVCRKFIVNCCCFLPALFIKCFVIWLSLTEYLILFTRGAFHLCVDYVNIRESHRWYYDLLT